MNCGLQDNFYINFKFYVDDALKNKQKYISNNFAYEKYFLEI